jgi:hypothetical protein
MFEFYKYDTRTFIKPEYAHGDNICQVERDGEQRSWSVYDGDKRRVESLGGDMHDRKLASFSSRKAAYDFVCEHYAPDYPVVAKHQWDEGYPIFHKAFAGGYEMPIGFVKKIKAKKYGVFIDSSGDEPLFTATTIKACRESLKTAQLEFRPTVSKSHAVAPEEPTSEHAHTATVNTHSGLFAGLAIAFICLLALVYTALFV